MRTGQKNQDFVIKLRKENPLITQTEMSDRIGCSRQRVHQILKKINLTLVPLDLSKYKKVDCLNDKCSKSITVKIKSPYKKHFCCSDCKESYYKKTLICDNCNVAYTLKRYIYNRKIRLKIKYNLCSVKCRNEYQLYMQRTRRKREAIIKDEDNGN